jgi:hypothetical protein
MKKSNRSWLSLAIAGVLCSGLVAAETDGSLVEFRIPANTGARAWNSSENPVRVKVGDTLRIINDDSISHRLHTFDRPCPHQDGESRPGEFYDCVVSTTVDPQVDLLYDHNFGPEARFWLVATPAE